MRKVSSAIVAATTREARTRILKFILKN
jgi:hypothetical protein